MRMSIVQHHDGYKKWLLELKQKIRTVQIKAAVTVNSEMLSFYWELGADIVEKQASANWGDRFLSKLSQDLMIEFPGMKGFSKRNLELIRQWYLFYSQNNLIAKQLVSQLTAIPYIFDFMTLAKDYTERDLEKNLIDHISHFLLEIGSGFAYVGRQIQIFISLWGFQNISSHSPCLTILSQVCPALRK